MRVRVASGVLRGSPSIQENTIPVECGFIQHVGEGGEEWRGGPLWSPAVPLKHGDPTLLHSTWTRKD